jgi:hypothetical protein
MSLLFNESATALYVLHRDALFHCGITVVDNAS